MTDRIDDLRRVNDALAGALEAHSDDLDHPEWEALEGLVRGTLSDVDREIVEAHVATCRICGEDAADLRAVQAQIDAAPAAPERRAGRMIIVWGSAGLAAAAGLIAAVWFGRSVSQPTVTPAPAVVATAAAPASPLRGDEASLVARSVAGRHLELPPDAADLSPKPGRQLASGSTFDLFAPLGPIGTAVVSARPVFTWQPARGALAYTVAVYDDRFNETMKSGRVQGTTWTPAVDLARSSTYEWQVTAHFSFGDATVPTPPRPEARFRVVDARTAAAAEEQQSRLAGQPVALGILMARAGLFVEAQRALQEAVERPEDAAVARALLDDLKARR